MNYPTVLYKSYPDNCREVADETQYQKAIEDGFKPLAALLNQNSEVPPAPVADPIPEPILGAPRVDGRKKNKFAY